MFVYKFFKNKYKTQDFVRLRSADDIYVRRCRGFKYQMLHVNGRGRGIIIYQ